MAWFLPLLIGLALNIVAYLILPKPKGPKPEAVKDAEDPEARAGEPIPLLSGSMTIKGLNMLYFAQKSTQVRTITEGSGKK